MERFKDFAGVALPYVHNDVDTDQIIPKQFLTSVKKSGYGLFLFNDERWLNPAADANATIDQLKPRPESIFNDDRYSGAQILVAGENFGCGSSREHAVWALANYGFKTVIAPSFADIFASNASKNGLLLVSLPREAVDRLGEMCTKTPGTTFQIVLDDEQPHVVAAGERFEFSIDAGAKERLLEGLDDIAVTERHVDRIRDYEQQRQQQEPWLDIGSRG